jgi:hypothetical protein
MRLYQGMEPAIEHGVNDPTGINAKQRLNSAKRGVRSLILPSPVLSGYWYRGAVHVPVGPAVFRGQLRACH